jgi:glycosyltransferase involved in cell wall biosynthesis
LEQGYPSVEIIVVDDGSTDNTVDVLRPFRDRVKLLTGPNEGACAARNRGLELSSAEYLLFLDADDYIDPGSLAAWVKTASDAAADIVLGPFAYEQGGGRTMGRSLAQSANALVVLRYWLEGQFTPCCSVLWRRSFLKWIGGWNLAAQRNQDGELVLRSLIEGARVAVAKHGLGIYVHHASSDRISKRTGGRVLVSQLSILQGLWERAKSRGYSEAQSSFSVAMYRIACEAFAIGVNDVGRLALADARKLGFRGHRGTRLHRVMAPLLGLRAKMRVAGFLRHSRDRLSRWRVFT